ncbi:MAG: hypothetical protein ACRBN8_24115 [Nannocystales bacterium]
MSTVPAKLFKNKTPTEASDIATARVKAAKKSSAKKIDEAEAAVEAAKQGSKGQSFAQLGTAVAIDGGMEALFVQSKTAAKYETAGSAIVAVVSGGAALAFDGYGSSIALGVCQATASRTARKLIRMGMSAA